MTNYQFGQMVYDKCYVAQVREEIRDSLQRGEQLSDAELGFIDIILNKECKSMADRTFLKKLEHMTQPNLLEMGKK